MLELENRLKIRGKLEIILYGPDGGVKDREVIKNTICAVGDAHVANKMSDAGEVAMSHMAIGTGSGGGASSTALVSELSRVALTSTTQGSGDNDNDVLYVGTWGAGVGTGAITEAGIFNDPTVGTILAYQSFAVKNKGALDSLVINWTITFGAS